MNNFLKQAGKGLKNATKVVADGLEEAEVSGQVDKITERIEQRIAEIDYSDVASKADLNARFDKWKSGSLKRFDERFNDPKVINHRQRLVVKLDTILENFHAAYDQFVETVLLQSTQHVQERKTEIISQLPRTRESLKAETDALSASTWQIFCGSKKEGNETSSTNADGTRSDHCLKLVKLIDDAVLEIDGANEEAVKLGVAKYCAEFGYIANITLTRNE